MDGAAGEALAGEAQLEGFLRWTDQPLVKRAETGLVLLLAAAAGFSVAAGLVFALNVV